MEINWLLRIKIMMSSNCLPKRALSVPCSRNTVAKILKRAQELDISWPLEDNQTDEVLEGLFYPKQCDRSATLHFILIIMTGASLIT